MVIDKKTISRLLTGKINIICHHNADPDAICAAYVMLKIVQKVNSSSKVKIIYPDTASQLSEKVIAHFNIDASNKLYEKNPDTFIILDTGSLSQLEQFSDVIKSSKAEKIFIDHHTRDFEINSIATLYIHNERATSTCEIVYSIFKDLRLKLNQEIAEALLIGIAFDSKHFSIGTSETFRAVADLLDYGASIAILKELLMSKMNNSEKIARLKACNRMKIHREGNWILASSMVGSFQSSVARSFIGLGADVAIVTGDENGKFRASFRSTDEFYEKTNIHLGDDITKSLSAFIKGSGGGHSTAAGFNGEGNSEEFIIKTIDLLSHRIKLLDKA